MNASGEPQVLSYGGGLDSFAMLVDAIQRGEKPDACVFMDVGNGAADREGTVPGEWPSTYRHMREVVLPLCAREGIRFIWLSHDEVPVRDADSLWSWFWDRYQIPVQNKLTRICTVVAKVERFEKWLERTYPGRQVEVWIGFEAGEEDRIQKDPNAGKGAASGRRNRFPLHERGLCRCRCEKLVRDAGYPVPRKSACTFCPFASKADWQTLARELPDTFALVAELEKRKPPTDKNGKKLSIMGYKGLKVVPKKTKMNVLYDKHGAAYVAPTIDEFIKGEVKPESATCGVCGSRRATKRTGCDYVAQEQT